MKFEKASNRKPETRNPKPETVISYDLSHGKNIPSYWMPGQDLESV